MELEKPVLRYMKGLPGKGIHFKRHGHLNVVGYSDANWAGSKNDCHST